MDRGRIGASGQPTEVALRLPSGPRRRASWGPPGGRQGVRQRLLPDTFTQVKDHARVSPMTFVASVRNALGSPLYRSDRQEVTPMSTGTEHTADSLVENSKSSFTEQTLGRRPRSGGGVPQRSGSARLPSVPVGPDTDRAFRCPVRPPQDTFSSRPHAAVLCDPSQGDASPYSTPPRVAG